MSVVGCSPTTWLQPRAPQELKVELSVPDASVPPTGVKTIRIYLPRPPYAAVPAMAHGPPSPGWPPASLLTHTHTHTHTLPSSAEGYCVIRFWPRALPGRERIFTLAA